MATFTKYTDYDMAGEYSYYTATVNGFEVTVWKGATDWGKGKWAFALTDGPIKMKNRCRTLKEAKAAATELAKTLYGV